MFCRKGGQRGKVTFYVKRTDKGADGSGDGRGRQGHGAWPPLLGMMTTTLLKALAQRRGFRGREDGWNECSEERERERETKITGVERRGEEGRGGRTSLCKRSVG